jgi:hypothetical protein
MAMSEDRDPANPSPEELREHAAAEGLAASEEETDPSFAEAPTPETAEPVEEQAPTGQPPVGGG